MPPEPKPPSLTDFSPLFPSDRPKAPQAVELDSATAWAEFERLSQAPAPAADHAFAPTVAQELPSFDPAMPSPASGHPLELQAVLVEARRGNRVCPQPAAWQRLYDVLASNGTGQPPPRPVEAAFWHDTGGMAKRMCLRDQIEWADRQGSLAGVMAFMQALPEGEWLHMDAS